MTNDQTQFFIIRHGLWLLIALQLITWTAIPLIFHTSLPYDVIELLTLQNEWVVANYKHPNLPGWIYSTAINIFGDVKIVYLLSQLCIISAYLAIYSFSKEFLGHIKALVATALTSSILYYHWPTPEFNHNVLQIPLWAIASLSAWRAVTREELKYWITLGVTAGLLVWTKYSSGLLLALITLWIFSTKPGRSSFKTPSPYLALTISLLIAWPQFSYLFESNFLPLEYASSRANAGGLKDSLAFMGAQLADHLFFFLLALSVGFLWKGAKTTPEKANTPLSSFIWIVLISPLMIIALLPIFAGIGLKPMWGTPMFNFSGFLLIYWFGNRLNIIRAKRLILACLVLIPVIGSLSGIEHIYKTDNSDKPSRTLWPREEISQTLINEFKHETGKDLKYVLGHYWDAGLVASGNIQNIRTMVGGDDIKSPWISESELAKNGYMIVWQTGTTPESALNERILLLKKQGYAEHTTTFDWSTNPEQEPIKLSYIVKPGSV